MKEFLKKYGHALLGLYLFIYLPCFVYLEAHVTSDYYLIHCPLDDYIPFCEYFIIPYYFWFVFVAAGCVYFFFKSQGECIRMGAYLIIGMSIAVAVCFIFPNGLGDFRPAEFPRENLFTDLVSFLYSADTSTNVLPSLHVYNTLVIVVAVFKSKTFGRRHTAMKIAVSIIGVLICASTMFLKQHSVYDVLAAVFLAAVLYPLIYHTRFFARFT